MPDRRDSTTSEFYSPIAEWRELEQAMKRFLDSKSPAREGGLLYYSSNQVQTIQTVKESIFFNTCLVLSVIFCVLELAVHLLRADTCVQALALILAVTIWAASAVAIEFIEPGGSGRFHVLCTAALLSNLLLLVSRSTSTSLGLSMYMVDCLMKFALALLIHPASANPSANITDKVGVRTSPASPPHH